MKRSHAAARLRPYANVNKLASLVYVERKRVASDIAEVLAERAAYRLYFWVALAIMSGTIVFATWGILRHG